MFRAVKLVALMSSVKPYKSTILGRELLLSMFDRVCGNGAGKGLIERDSDKQHCIIKLQVTPNVSFMNIKIQNKDPPTNLSINKSAKKKVSKANSLDYRGMTLKEYFRLSEVGAGFDNQQIKQTQQQNACSSKEAVTPCFNEFNGRQKIKTEVYEDKSFIEDKPSFLQKQKNKQIFPFQNKTKHLKVEKLPTEIRPKKDSKNNKNKRAITLGASHKDHLNRSTITSFYQLENKKKKMLQKVKMEKERINELKLSDAFFITKYAQKFHISPHHAF